MVGFAADPPPCDLPHGKFSAGMIGVPGFSFRGSGGAGTIHERSVVQIALTLAVTFRAASGFGGAAITGFTHWAGSSYCIQHIFDDSHIAICGNIDIPCVAVGVMDGDGLIVNATRSHITPGLGEQESQIVDK